jgi:hypothetical protein
MKNETQTAAPARRFIVSGKTFASVENLDRALARHGFLGLPHLVCNAPDGRVTAVFFGPDANAVIFAGFQWIVGWDRRA